MHEPKEPWMKKNIEQKLPTSPSEKFESIPLEEKIDQPAYNPNIDEDDGGDSRDVSRSLINDQKK